MIILMLKMKKYHENHKILKFHQIFRPRFVKIYKVQKNVKTAVQKEFHQKWVPISIPQMTQESEVKLKEAPSLKTARTMSQSKSYPVSSKIKKWRRQFKIPEIKGGVIQAVHNLKKRKQLYIEKEQGKCKVKTKIQNQKKIIENWLIKIYLSILKNISNKNSK